jgi:hypothetical protein
MLGAAASIRSIESYGMRGEKLGSVPLSPWQCGGVNQANVDHYGSALNERFKKNQNLSDIAFAKGP